VLQAGFTTCKESYGTNTAHVVDILKRAGPGVACRIMEEEEEEEEGDYYYYYYYYYYYEEEEEEEEKNNN
jgi:hypothetical protein